jgi:hypothetical protein
MKLVGDWLVIGNTVETTKCYTGGSPTWTLTDISNFYNMAGANIFDTSSRPHTWQHLGGSRSTSGMLSTREVHLPAELHLGKDDAAAGINQITDSIGQLTLGVNGANGAGVLASSNKGLVYTDFNTGYNGAGILRLQAPGIQTTNEVQLIAGTTAPAPLVRASEGKLAFNNTAPIAKPTVTGSRGGNAALASLLTALANYGLITDSTTA